MHKSIKTYSYALLLTAAMLFMISCKDDDNGNKTTAPAAPETETPKANLISGNYDTLWINRAAFDTINNGAKFVFAYTFTANDKLTLGGWIERNVAGNKFNNTPNLVLANGRAGSITYGPGTYFGDIVLVPQEYNKVKQVLNTTNGQFVLFAPTMLNGEFFYKIFISTDDPSAMVSILAITPTDAVANPSPPKNYD